MGASVSWPDAPAAAPSRQDEEVVHEVTAIAVGSPWAADGFAMPGCYPVAMSRPRSMAMMMVLRARMLSR